MQLGILVIASDKARKKEVVGVCVMSDEFLGTVIAVSLCMYMVPSPFAPRGAVLSRDRGPTGVTFSPSLVMTSSWTIGVGSTGRRSAATSGPLSSVLNLHFSPTPHIRACRGCWRIMRLYSLDRCQCCRGQGHRQRDTHMFLRPSRRCATGTYSYA